MHVTDVDCVILPNLPDCLVLIRSHFDGLVVQVLKIVHPYEDKLDEEGDYNKEAEEESDESSLALTLLYLCLLISLLIVVLW